jgi:hypothetical protein
MAAQSRGSVKILVRPPIEIAQFVDAEQVDASVAGDGLGQLFLVGGLDELVDGLRGERIADPEPGHRGSGAETDQEMGLAGAEVTDQAQRLALLDPFAGGKIVDQASNATTSAVQAPTASAV